MGGGCGGRGVCQVEAAPCQSTCRDRHCGGISVYGSRTINSPTPPRGGRGLTTLNREIKRKEKRKKSPRFHSAPKESKSIKRRKTKFEGKSEIRCHHISARLGDSFYLQLRLRTLTFTRAQNRHLHYMHNAGSV